MGGEFPVQPEVTWLVPWKTPNHQGLLRTLGKGGKTQGFEGTVCGLSSAQQDDDNNLKKSNFRRIPSHPP